VLELRVEEVGVCSVGVSVRTLFFSLLAFANVLLRKNQSCDNCRNRKVRCAQTEEASKRKRDRAEDGGSEKKRSKGKGKAGEADNEDEAEWRRRMELRAAEMEERIMARLDRGFASLRRRMLALEQQVDTEWREILAKADPEESDGGSEADTEMGEGDGEDTRDKESVAEEVAGEVAGDPMEE
jgi:hypothetical protein